MSVYEIYKHEGGLPVDIYNTKISHAIIIFVENTPFMTRSVLKALIYRLCKIKVIQGLDCTHL